MDDATFGRIFDAFQEHSVLVFRDQVLTDEQQMALSRRLGPLEVTLQSIGQERRLHENLVDLRASRTRCLRRAASAATPG